jgi:hypothetical protein
LGNLCRAKAACQLLWVEKRLDPNLSYEGRARAGGVQISLLNIGIQHVGEHSTQRHDRQQGEQPETYE